MEMFSKQTIAFN